MSTIPALRAEDEASRNLTEPAPQRHDRHEPYDQHPTPEQQRQQHTLPRTPTPLRQERDPRSTPSSGHRGLRRTPRFEATPSPRPSQRSSRRVHLEAVSVGISPVALVATAGSPPAVVPKGKGKELAPPAEVVAPPARPRRLRRQLSQDLSDDLDAESTVPTQFPRHRFPPYSARQEPTAHPAVRISKHTHRAILWTLEEALRQPNPFTPDLDEENASMAELMRGGGAGTGAPPVSNGQPSQSSRPTAAPPAPTGSPAGIRGPRMIMRDRMEREARQRAEREQVERLEMEREREEREQELLKERERERERRTTAHSAAGAADIPTQTLDPAVQRRQRRAAEAQAQAQAQAQAHHAQGSSQPAQASQSRPPRTTQAAGPSFSGPQPTGGPTSGPSGAEGGQGNPTGETSSGGAGRPRNSFPHAFERWEALSAHWEGLTSFWIRRLQQHSEEIDRDPLSQQLSRQVTDLSAAGANLFHAVVELQRLRASSERKFQRWFFDTRAELERNQEINAMLAAQLDEERRGRTDAIRDAVEHERANSKTQRQLADMRKELLISKEEARRAWEELGRRQEHEQETINALHAGQPAHIAGINVVSMIHGIPTRHTSTRDQPQQQQPDYAGAGYGEGPSRQASSAGAVPATNGGSDYYQRPAPAVHEQPSYGAGGSEGGFSEEDYEPPVSHVGSVPLATTPAYSPEQQAQQQQQQPQQWADAPAGTPAQQNPLSLDNGNQSYAAPGWETVPRHRHPTRLSVIEEDERSRTSASISQVSRP